MHLLSQEAYLSKAQGLDEIEVVDFSGRWKNQYGSEMNLEVDGSLISGTYISKAATAGGEVRGDIKGFVKGDLISFVVNWERSISITSWVGQMVEEESDRPQILTLWHLATDIPNEFEPKEIWKSVLAGSDTFERP